MSTTQITPEVLWAQRSSATVPEQNKIYLTISVPDVEASSCKIDLKPASLTFTGHSSSKKATYHIELDFYAEIDVENSKPKMSARDIEFVLRKKEAKEEYWPRLLKSSQKFHFLKTDFDKWVDEDEQNEKADDDNFGGMDGMDMGMPGMGGGGMGGDGGFGGIDFSKLGAGGDVSDDVNALGGGDDSDNDMPDLVEGEDEKPASGAGKIVEGHEGHDHEGHSH